MDQREKYAVDGKGRRKEKLKDILCQIVFYIWMFIFCVILFWFLVTNKEVGWKESKYAVGAFVIWMLITAVVFIIRDRKSIFVKKKVLEEVVIEDLRFGTLKCVKDRNDLDVDLKCDALNFRFGKYNPKIEIRNYQDENQEQYFTGLAYVYDIQNEIISNLYQKATDYCAEWEECDEDGNPITYEYIKDNFDISDMIISMVNRDVFITIMGWSGDGLLGEHNINAQINCTRKTIDYLLEG